MHKLKFGISVTDCPIEPGIAITLRGKIEKSIIRAAALGYDAVEINLAEPLKYDRKTIGSVLKNEGIVCCATASGLSVAEGNYSLIADEKAKRLAAIDKLKEHIDFAAELGACHVIGMFRGKIPDMKQYSKYTLYYREALDCLGEYAKKVQTVLVLEAINMYFSNYLNSVRTMGQFIRELNIPNIKLHIDSHHMNIHDIDIISTIKENAGEIAYVHLSDSNRYAPGLGNINFFQYVRALRDIQFDGYSTVEAIPYPTEERAAELSLKLLKVIEECYDTSPE